MESAAELAAEHPQPVEKVRQCLAEMAATADTMIRRVLIVAERRRREDAVPDRARIKASCS